jgi:Regulator of chromosome condensation (RCC1) repeat
MPFKTCERQPIVVWRQEMKKATWLVAIAILGLVFVSSGAPDALAVQPKVAAGWEHTVGLKSDGTVVATGDNSGGQLDVTGWTGIIQVVAGGYHTVGLKSDGTVVATGWTEYRQCNVSGLVLSVDNHENNTIPIPTSATVIQCSGVAIPMLNADPNQAVPIGLGDIATGGDTVSIELGMAGFNGPVDIYFGVFMPALDPVNIWILKHDTTFQPHSSGIVPWKTSITNPTSELLFNEIPIAVFAQGTYYVYLAATPAGKGFSGSFYLWMTEFEVEGPIEM